jgi:TonB family protein
MNFPPLAAALLLVVSPALLTAQLPVRPVEVRPALIDSSCKPPAHPDILRKAGIEGRVLLAFVVDTNGTVDSTTVSVISTSHVLFERPARTAIVTCRFRPGRSGGHAVRMHMQQPINFVLPERPPQ